MPVGPPLVPFILYYYFFWGVGGGVACRGSSLVNIILYCARMVQWLLLLFVVVILVPTRELALQTSQVCKELGKHLKIQVMVTTGGTSLKDDIIRLYQPVHLLVGTPGRILDLTKKGICILKDCSMLIMDEVIHLFFAIDIIFSWKLFSSSVLSAFPVVYVISWLKRLFYKEKLGIGLKRIVKISFTIKQLVTKKISVSIYLMQVFFLVALS